VFFPGQRFLLPLVDPPPRSLLALRVRNTSAVHRWFSRFSISLPPFLLASVVRCVGLDPVILVGVILFLPQVLPWSPVALICPTVVLLLGIYCRRCQLCPAAVGLCVDFTRL
jgi:hypothetical protein